MHAKLLQSHQTLYSVINQLNDNKKKIITIEDPVEYKTAGLCQMQVNEKIGVTFGAGLRSIVRQDPDIILVGEIRDRETADIAINAALTGHPSSKRLEALVPSRDLRAMTRSPSPRVKAQHEGALPPPCIVRKDPRVPHTARRGA